MGELNYNNFAVAEVLVHMACPHVEKADFILSHAQGEPLDLTLNCMKNFTLSLEKDARYFVDYYCLRQLIDDFDLSKVLDAIKSIGHTLMVACPSLTPTTIGRSFCCFELYATKSSNSPFAVVVPPRETDMLVSHCEAFSPDAYDSAFLVKTDTEAAQCRSAPDKATIDEYIVRGPGFKAIDTMVEDVMRVALLQATHVADRAKRRGSVPFALVLAVLRQVAGRQGQSEASDQAQRLLMARGYLSMTLVHRFVYQLRSITLEQFEELLGYLSDPREALKHSCTHDPPAGQLTPRKLMDLAWLGWNHSEEEQAYAKPYDALLQRYGGE